MKPGLCFAGAIVLATGTMAHGTTIGVTLANEEYTFVQSLKETFEARSDVEIVIVDAEGDGERQLEQIRQFQRDGVDAIVVNPVQPDDGITITMTAGDLPLVYVNQEPINSMMLPPTQVYVGSNETVAGTLEMTEVCRLLEGQGTISILIGRVDTSAARTRTQAVLDVLETEECSGISVAREGQANWRAGEAETMVSEWLAAGVTVDAYVANNDDMALGAIRALQASGQSLDNVVIAGVDATADALAAMGDGTMQVTVFQNAAGQADTSVDVALRLLDGETVDSHVWVPFELVTPANISEYR